MKTFKFVYREEELCYAKSALESNNFVLYHYNDKSGLSHYLKKLQIELNTTKQVCFYVDCSSTLTIAEQVATQILSGLDRNEILVPENKKSEITKKLIHSLVSSVDVIPFVNIGELVNGLVDAINSTLDVDIEHLSDYKIEKAIMNLLKSTEESSQYKTVIFLLDNVSRMEVNSINFLSKLMTFSCAKFLLTVSNRDTQKSMETLSKLSKADFTLHKIERHFERPDNRLICGLFECYQKEYKTEYMDVFEQYERNIHIIMSFIHGFNMDFMQLDAHTIYLLKVLTLLGCGVNEVLLKKIIQSEYEIENIGGHYFSNLINKLCELNFAFKDSDNNLIINKNLVNEYVLHLSLLDKLTISRTIVDVFEEEIQLLSAPLLKFAIRNLDKDYNRRKRFILVLLDIQKKMGRVEQEYLDKVPFFSNKQDLLKICSLYYDLQLYDIPETIILRHGEFLEERECKVMLALLRERMHVGHYSEELCSLIDTSTNIDESCLLVAILFTALFNEGKSSDGMEILCNPSSDYYYRKFETSKCFPFLLRNVSYYIDDVDVGIRNYTECLQFFKNSDPVNYNRTMTNFIGYLLKNHDSRHANIVLKQKIKEAKQILEYDDPRYLYLNINYGIYLMKETEENPSQHFESILYESGTTETPHIYAQVNHAMYISKESPEKALVKLDEIDALFVSKTCVEPTKVFYSINRLLVEYMNGINNVDLLEYIRKNPLRGNTAHAECIYSEYSNRFKNNIPYIVDDWQRLFMLCPGYIFYHGFDSELLLSSFDNPTRIM